MPGITLNSPPIIAKMQDKHEHNWESLGEPISLNPRSY